MRLFTPAERAPDAVVRAAGLRRGEKVLAFAQDESRWVLGTRVALVIVETGAAEPGTAEPGTVRLPWEEVQAADWDQDAGTLTVSEVGQYGDPRRSFVFTLENPALLLQLVRERVTASVVLQRGYLVVAKRGLKVIGRRSPDGGEIRWMFEYDAGIDPESPEVQAAAAEALARARADVGE